MSWIGGRDGIPAPGRLGKAVHRLSAQGGAKRIYSPRHHFWGLWVQNDLPPIQAGPQIGSQKNRWASLNRWEVITICDSHPGVLELWSDGFPILHHSMTPTARFTICGNAGRASTDLSGFQPVLEAAKHGLKAELQTLQRYGDL